MRKRTIVGTIAAAYAAAYLARKGFKLAAEIQRYNHMRSLSDEGPLSEDAPQILMEVLRKQQQVAREWLQFFKSAPKDAARYTKIETI